MPLKNNTIFLAGATGLVGTAIINTLINAYPSVRIRAAYHHSVPLLQNDRVEYVQGDLASMADCKRMATGCDCAIMAAARTSGAAVLTSRPWEQVTDNLLMNTVMLQAFFELGIRRAVFVSSASLYQEQQGLIKETDLDLNKEPHTAHSGIGWVMRFLEKLCGFWHQQGMEIVIARAANIFGPRARFDPATSNFIPALVRKAVDRMDPYEVWGNPRVTRDVIYVDDFARAVVTMLNRDDIKFDIFNIGTGTATTVADVVRWALKYAGHTPSSVLYSDKGPTTVPFRVLDCTRSGTVLGWRPEIPVEEGVKRTVEWWQIYKTRWEK